MGPSLMASNILVVSSKLLVHSDIFSTENYVSTSISTKMFTGLVLLVTRILWFVVKMGVGVRWAQVSMIFRVKVTGQEVKG